MQSDGDVDRGTSRQGRWEQVVSRVRTPPRVPGRVDRRGNERPSFHDRPRRSPSSCKTDSLRLRPRVRGPTSSRCPLLSHNRFPVPPHPSRHRRWVGTHRTHPPFRVSGPDFSPCLLFRGCLLFYLSWGGCRGLGSSSYARLGPSPESTPTRGSVHWSPL